MNEFKRVIGSAIAYEKIEILARDVMIDDIETAIAEILQKWSPDINCFNFHLELKARFPHASAWASPDHWLSEIDGMLFDKTGLLFIQQKTTDKAFKKAFKMPPVNDF